jgi:hypothetical protein
MRLTPFESTTLRGGLSRNRFVWLAILLLVTLLALLLDPIPLIAITRCLAIGVIGGVFLAPGLPVLGVPIVLLLVFGTEAVSRSSVAPGTLIGGLLPLLIALTTSMIVAVAIDAYLRRRAARGSAFARTWLGETAL